MKKKTTARLSRKDAKRVLKAARDAEAEFSRELAERHQFDSDTGADSSVVVKEEKTWI